MEIIQSPLFYMGNKYNLLSQLKPLFPPNIDTFYDLFGGGGSISLNIYTLTFFSFCNLIRFNSKNEFNMPFGNRCYLKEHDYQIANACYRISKQNIETKNEDALNYIKNNFYKFKQNDFIYLDPPYLNTTAVYNEKRAFGGWSIDDDYRLFNLLELLNARGIKWGLSNVFKNKEYTNEHLIKWCKDNNWNVNHLDKEYASLGKGTSNTDEVYICNYETPKQMSIFDYGGGE